MADRQDQFIEARILTGLIVSTEFLRRIKPAWDDEYIESVDVALVAGWVWDYFDRYGEAPDEHIQDIYMGKLREGLAQDRGEIIEMMLDRASKDYGRSEQFNVDYLLDQAHRYFRERRVERLEQDIRGAREAGDAQEAERLITQYSNLPDELESGVYAGTDEADAIIDRAFNEEAHRVVYYPGPVGQMLNPHLVRGGFVSFLAPEKRGKTWLLLDMAIRAIRQSANVAFFQAGDMNDPQQFRRLCTYLTKRPPESSMPPDGKVMVPTRDCIHNQADTCSKDVRECDFGVFDEDSDDWDPSDLRNALTADQLRQAAEQNPDYRPCYNCKAYESHQWGVPWFKEMQVDWPLDAEQAKSKHREFFGQYANRLKVSTHPSDTLTIEDIQGLLDEWERRDGFVPDVIIVDYADLMAVDGQDEFRHKQDRVWKGLRSINQARHCLMITATQADAKSYSQGRLGMTNFSEDKRKMAHVTAMFGLNRDAKGREKELGLMRVNEIAVREGDFAPFNEVHLLQALSIGRPFTGSYW